MTHIPHLRGQSISQGDLAATSSDETSSDPGPLGDRHEHWSTVDHEKESDEVGQVRARRAGEDRHHGKSHQPSYGEEAAQHSDGKEASSAPAQLRSPEHCFPGGDEPLAIAAPT